MRKNKAQRTIYGTFKVQIIKPVNSTWEEVGPRMHALRKTAGPALNRMQQALWPRIQRTIEAWRSGDPRAKEIQRNLFLSLTPQQVREIYGDPAVEHRSPYKVFHAAWQEELVGLRDWEENQGRTPHSRAHEAPHSDVSNATQRMAFQPQWMKDNWREHLAGRRSVPNWKGNVPFRFGGNVASGDADAARVSFPLRKGARTEFEVAVNGDGDRAKWNRMADPEDGSFECKSVAIQWDERKRKWFAAVSYAQTLPRESQSKRVAVAHLGVNQFLMLMDQDGNVFRRSGTDMLHVRRSFGARIGRVQRDVKFAGRGTRGHGVKRRFQKVSSLKGKLQNRMRDMNLQLAKQVADWCVERKIGILYLEDLRGVGEKATKELEVSGAQGKALRNMNRLIRSWPYYDFQQALERAVTKRGVRVKYKGAWRVSVTCPKCNFKSESEVTYWNEPSGYVVVNGQTHERHERRAKLKCSKCESSEDADVVACVNHLRQVDVKMTLGGAKRASTRKALAGVK